MSIPPLPSPRYWHRNLSLSLAMYLQQNYYKGLIITWRATCSKRLAAPLVFADSLREPASIQTPTVAAPDERFSSVATVRPLGKLVMRVAEACLAAVAKGRTNYILQGVSGPVFFSFWCSMLLWRRSMQLLTCLVKPTLAWRVLERSLEAIFSW